MTLLDEKTPRRIRRNAKIALENLGISKSD
jgi:hypothetical protein